MRAACYWCLGPELKRPHAAGCPAERGVPASHQPKASAPTALPGVDDVPEEVTAPALDRYRTDLPFVPEYLRRAGVL